MFEQEEQRDELLEKIEDLISRKRYAELRDLLLPLEAQDIAGLFMEGSLGTARVGYKIDGRVTWRNVFNASAPVLPGFGQTRRFTL